MEILNSWDFCTEYNLEKQTKIHTSSRLWPVHCVLHKKEPFMPEWTGSRSLCEGKAILEFGLKTPQNFWEVFGWIQRILKTIPLVLLQGNSSYKICFEEDVYELWDIWREVGSEWMWLIAIFSRVRWVYTKPGLGGKGNSVDTPAKT